MKLMKIKFQESISLNFFPSNILKKIKEIDHDIIHLHWVNNEMLSIIKFLK